jgi:serine O-acetyltransferase
MKRILNRGLPSKKGIASFTKKLTVTLFPVTGGGICYLVSGRSLRNRLLLLLRPMRERFPDRPKAIVEGFFNALPAIKKQLEDDAASIAGNDPAATGIDEVIMTYPGFYAILVYRLANKLATSGVPLIPRVMTEYAHSITGIDIHPKATIGSPFFIDHGTGIVIGETAIIGKKVKLYQGVTIGALSVSKNMASTKRHPTIEDDVIIYAGSTILGGDTIVGHDSIIGGNVWLTESVPPYSLVYHQNVMTVRERGNDYQKQTDNK